MMHITHNHVQQGFQRLLAVLLGILNVGDVLAKIYDKCFMVTQKPCDILLDAPELCQTTTFQNNYIILESRSV
jgi:hypothetical protein